METLFVETRGCRRFVPVSLVVACAVALLTLTGCGPENRGVVIAGSSSVQPVMEKLADRFRKLHPGARVAVEGGGSSAGIMAALTGTAHLGMSSRGLKPGEGENQLQTLTIALDAIAVIVHPANPLNGLEISQLRRIFSGQIRNWKEVGGRDHAIHLIVREEGSGTRSAFEELVLKEGSVENPVDPFALVQDSTGGVREVVRGDPDAIGFISLGAVNETVKGLAVDGIHPEFTAVRDNRYKLTRPFLLISRGAPASQTAPLLDFAFSPEGAKIMLEEGLVSVERR